MFHNFFRKKISVEEAAKILGVSEYQSMHMVYLIWEVPLTQTSKFGKQGIHLYQDEVLNLRDSVNPHLQTVRRNQSIVQEAKLTINHKES